MKTIRNRFKRNLSVQTRSNATRRKRMRANIKKKVLWRHRQYVFVPSGISGQAIDPFIAETLSAPSSNL